MDQDVIDQLIKCLDPQDKKKILITSLEQIFEPTIKEDISNFSKNIIKKTINRKMTLETLSD